MSKTVFYPIVIASVSLFFCLAGWAYSGHEARLKAEELKSAGIEEWQTHVTSTIKSQLKEILNRLPECGPVGVNLESIPQRDGILNYN